MSLHLRALPIRVEPVEGETTDGYIGRIARVHLLEESDVRRLVLNQLGLSWWPVADPRVIDVVERLAELPPGALRADFDKHGMRVRCGHQSWRPAKCKKCKRFSEPRTACVVCARGIPTTTVAHGGALCFAHGLWAFRDVQVDVAGLAEYERAEQVLRSQLWQRGVALHTGELNLAAAFVRAWHAGASAPTIIDGRMTRFGVRELNTYEETLLCAYPEVTRVARVLTTPRTITPVLDVRVSALTQADLLMHAITDAIGQDSNDPLRNYTVAVVGHAHRAMLYMYGLRSSAQVKHQLCPLNRGLMVAAHRRRACLLRHANPGYLPDIAGKPGRAAPRTRVIRNWPFEVDELAMT